MSAKTENKWSRFPVVAVRSALVIFVLTLLSPFSAGATDKSQPIGKIDEQRLAGHWLRPDGGYVLQLREISPDGTLKATYLNPRPINVARTLYSRKDGRLAVYIELRDTNYPGSYYTLQYDPETDRLTGTYFQAIQRETFAVELLRIK